MNLSILRPKLTLFAASLVGLLVVESPPVAAQDHSAASAPQARAAAQHAPALSAKPARQGLAVPPKPAAARHSSVVGKEPVVAKGKFRIENHRHSTLLSLSLASGDDDAPDIVAQSLASGASVVVALPKPDRCNYDIDGRFEDWSRVTVENFDLCKDQTLNITE